MEEGKKIIQRLTGGKKLQKDQCLILVLIGILLCVIAIPTEKKDSKSDLSNGIDDTIDNYMIPDKTDEPADYIQYWEDKLEETLSCADGVGKVRVLITLQSSEQKIVEKDGPEEYTDTAEEDGAGGVRTIGESRVEKSTIYSSDGQGGNVPYVVMTIPPSVEGVVVIAQMADQENIRQNIIEAIQVLFDIDANKIKIVKMKKISEGEKKLENMIKKNQMMITALAIMIAVAGYLNFAGTKVTDEDLMSVNGEIATDDLGNLAVGEEDPDYASLADLSDEDLEQASGDIESLDTDVTMAVSGGIDEELAEALAEEQMEDVPGEAVFTSGTVSEMSGAKMQKEQTRAQNKETLLEIINNANISDTQKQEAVNSMISMTDIAEKETAAEILLEAKGFEDAIVSIDGESVDVVVNTAELTEAQRAQIEDIVIRKTGVGAESIVISTVNAN